MSKYIDADSIMQTCYDSFLKTGNKAYSEIIALADAVPAADVQEVRHGLWETEVRTIYGHKIPFFVCSVCGKSAADEYNYCPNCGIRMDLDEVAE